MERRASLKEYGIHTYILKTKQTEQGRTWFSFHKTTNKFIGVLQYMIVFVFFNLKTVIFIISDCHQEQQQISQAIHLHG